MNKCLKCGLELQDSKYLCDKHSLYLPILKRFRYYKYKPRGFGLDVIYNYLKYKNNIIIKAPRGVGKSVLVDLIALDQALHNKDYFILISSVSFDNSKEHIRRIRDMIKSSIFNYLIRDEDRVDTVSFRHNNSRILAIPQSENTRVGYHPNLKIIDELARMKDSFYWSVLKPMGAQSYSKEIIISTPVGATGIFRELWDIENSYIKFNISINDCWWIDKQYLENIKKQMPEIFYIQEVLGEFIDSAYQVFNTNLIKNAIHDYNLKEKITDKAIMAIDFGRKHDYTAIIILNYKGEVLNIFTTQAIWKKQVELINNIYKSYSIEEVIIDATGLGDVMLDQLNNLNPESYIFTQASKLELINNLIVSLQNNEIKIHSKFKDLIKQLEYYHWTDNKFNKAEAIRGHDDILCALMLANYKLNQTKQSYSTNIWSSRT